MWECLAEAQFDTFSGTVFGAGVSVGQTASLKRLHFEAATLVVASLKERVSGDGSEVTSVKKVATAEKRARREAQAGRLQGLRSEGELSPSHQLIDLANHIIETGTIVWIAPSRCTKRDDEVQLSIKERASTIQVGNSQLKVSAAADDTKADVGSELKLQWCFQRRGIAFDQCRLVLMKSGYQFFSMINSFVLTVCSGQSLQGNRGTLKMDHTGVIALDARLEALITDPRVTMMLLPVPGAKSSESSKKGDSKNDKRDGSDDVKKVKKPKKTRAARQPPEELKKYNMSSEHGRICWSYNMKDGCSNKTNGKPAKCNLVYTFLPIARGLDIQLWYAGHCRQLEGVGMQL